MQYVKDSDTAEGPVRLTIRSCHPRYARSMIDLGTLAGLLERRCRLDANCPTAHAGRNAMRLLVSITIGGKGGIRTLGQLSLTPVLKSRTSRTREIKHKETARSLPLINFARHEAMRIPDPSGNGVAMAVGPVSRLQ